MNTSIVAPRSSCCWPLRCTAPVVGILLLAVLPIMTGCGSADDQKPEASDSGSTSADGKQAAAAQKLSNADESNADESKGGAAAVESSNAATGVGSPVESATPKAEPAADPGPKAEPPAIEDAVREPATVADAIAAVDLRKLPVPADVENAGLAIANAGFTTKQDAKATYAAIEKFLTDAGCKPYSDLQAYEGSMNRGFTRNGFRFSVSVSSVGGETNAMVFNLGNVNLSKLPVPPGAKPWHAFPDTAAFITDAGVEETREATRKVLLEQGWQPYGGAADTSDYKKNATSIGVTINSPPATPGQTVISFGSRQLSADLPAPPDATRVDYSDNPTQVYVEMPGTMADAFAFQQKTLTAAGWKATTDKPIEDGSVQTLIFRNDAKEMLTLTVREGGPLPTNYMLEYRTAEQVAKSNEAAKKLAAERAKEREEEEKQAEAERNKPKPKAAIPVPADAKDVEADEDDIRFHVASGQAKAAWEAIVKSLEADGWKSRFANSAELSGQSTLEKDGLTINVSYVDAAGFAPAQVSASGFRVVLEKK